MEQLRKEKKKRANNQHYMITLAKPCNPILELNFLREIRYDRINTKTYLNDENSFEREGGFTARNYLLFKVINLKLV